MCRMTYSFKNLIVLEYLLRAVTRNVLSFISRLDEYFPQEIHSIMCSRFYFLLIQSSYVCPKLILSKFMWFTNGKLLREFLTLMTFVA